MERKEVVTKTFTETELNQIEKFWKCVEQKTKIKHPLKREDYHKTPSAIRFIKKLCGNHPFDPEYAAKQFLILRKSW